MRERARHDLLVDRVRHRQPPLGRPLDEPEVEREPPVLRRDLVERLPREHRLDDAADARLGQAMGEALQVHVVPGDEDLLGAVHVGERDRLRGIGDHHLDELRSLAQRLQGDPPDALIRRDAKYKSFGLDADGASIDEVVAILLRLAGHERGAERLQRLRLCDLALRAVFLFGHSILPATIGESGYVRKAQTDVL